MQPHIFGLKKTAFVLWRPQSAQPAPALVVGRFQPGNPPALAQRRDITLQQTTHPDLWTVDAADCSLTDGQVYHYWFEVNDSSPFGDGRRILCTDPMAFTVDWRLCSNRLSGRMARRSDPAPS